MTADKHTAEPWRLGGTFMPGTSGESVNVWGPPAPGDQSGWIVASNLAPENARRIIACVNALAGISTEALEDAVTVAPLHRFGHLRDLMALHDVKAKDCA